MARDDRAREDDLIGPLAKRSVRQWIIDLLIVAAFIVVIGVLFGPSLGSSAG